MISMVICNSNKNELDDMVQYSHYLAAHLSEEEWQYKILTSSKELEEYVEAEPLVDIACIDLKIENSIYLVERLRKINRNAYIILVASLSISPMKYLRPSIMAGSLLVRVYSQEQLKEVFKEAFTDYLQKFQSDINNEDVYVIDSREGRQLISYDQIYYFEARNKKIVVGCKTKEISCYDTILNLTSNLPSYFVQCHRSFIVNEKKVKKVALEGWLELENDITVPISRTYKANVKKIPIIQSDL